MKFINSNRLKQWPTAKFGGQIVTEAIVTGWPSADSGWNGPARFGQAEAGKYGTVRSRSVGGWMADCAQLWTRWVHCVKRLHGEDRNVTHRIRNASEFGQISWVTVLLNYAGQLCCSTSALTRSLLVKRSTNTHTVRNSNGHFRSAG